jgi:tetratricopeptide (TPR) repeat protein
MSTYKVILSGRFDFGTERNLQQVMKFFEHRFENYYRKDILLKMEDIFDEEQFSLNVPRLIVNANEKSFRNTVNLLEYLAQFAISGSFHGWCTSEGKMVIERMIEPEGEKAATQAFLKGRDLIDKEGMEEEAKKALSRAIAKFERHAMAYERRGLVNLQLGNLDDAMYDYNKSIRINPDAPEAYLGRAYTWLKKGEFEKVIEDLTAVTKRSIPHQPMYWKARRMKGECHLRLEEYDKAASEFKFFVNRSFEPDNPNYAWRKTVWSNYGYALLKLQRFSEAIDAYNESLALEAKNPKASVTPEAFLYRGIARQKAGDDGFAKDWKEAASLGSSRAAELLESIPQ